MHPRFQTIEFVKHILLVAVYSSNMSQNSFHFKTSLAKVGMSRWGSLIDPTGKSGVQILLRPSTSVTRLN